MEWQIVISIGCTILGAVIGYATFARNKAKDDKNSGQQSGQMLTELGYIKSMIDQLTKKLDRQDERYLALSERVTAVEESAKQAHKRIDGLNK